MEKFTTIFNRSLLTAIIVCILSISAANAMDIADEDITTAIEADLFADSQLPVNKIDIETNEGIVKLSGTVDNILAKDRTEKIAESIVGVRSIVNLIEVDPPAHITDINIKKDVEQALIFDPATNSDDIEIEVEVDQGIVTLSGTASSWQQKRLCSTVAKGVKGVTEIVNNIKIEYGIERSDDQIKDEIQAMLSNDIKVDDAMIYIEVEDGNVMLKGSVGSLAEKNSARMLSWVSGVENVNTDHLEIKWWARDSMRRKKMYISRSDDEIEKAVTDAIMYDPRVNYFDINIDVKFGKVILSGVVDNLKAKKAAEWDAKNTIGVSIVNNNIRIRFAEDVSDDNLTSAITENFKSDPYLERFDIEVIVIGGKVYLYGDVNTS
ncbi:MAG: BON domain-containing protein [Sedimentisphaeraceae bacterium JB056]